MEKNVEDESFSRMWKSTSNEYSHVSQKNKKEIFP